MDITPDDIQATLGKLRAEEESLNRKLAEYQKTLEEREAVRHAIKGLEWVVERAEQATAPSTGTPIWKGAQALLEQRGGQPMTVAELTSELQGIGYNIKGKTPAESVRSILIRKPSVFEKVEGGKYRLKSN